MRSREVAVRGARVRSPLGLSPPGTRSVARATGSALPHSRINRSSAFSRARKENQTHASARRDETDSRKRFPRRLERNDRSPQRTFATRRVTPRARAAPPAHPRTSNPPFRLHHDVVPRRRRRRPPRGPVALHEHGPLDQVLRGVALQRLAGYVSRTSRAFRRTEPLTPASRAPTGTGRTGMFAIPPNNYDFYTEEEKYVLPRRGDETLVGPLVVAPNETNAGARRFSNAKPRRFLFPFVSFSFFFRRSPPKARQKALSRPPPSRTSHTCRVRIY
jgi:hypothetical protein